MPTQIHDLPVMFYAKSPSKCISDLLIKFSRNASGEITLRCTSEWLGNAMLRYCSINNETVYLQTSLPCFEGEGVKGP